MIDGCDCCVYQASRQNVRRPKGIEFKPIFVGTHGAKGIRSLVCLPQHDIYVGHRDYVLHMIGAECGDRGFRGSRGWRSRSGDRMSWCRWLWLQV